MTAEAPDLFSAVALESNAGVRFLARKQWWLLERDGRWQPQERHVPPGWVCSTAYTDPRRGVVTVGLIRTPGATTLCRVDAQGAEWDRSSLPDLDVLAFWSAAYDPVHDQLVFSNGTSGFPWGVLATAGDARRIPGFTSVVWHPGLQRLVAAVNFEADERSVRGTPTHLLTWEGEGWKPLTRGQGELWSQLFFDDARGTVTAFMQKQSGDDVLLYALENDGMVAVSPQVQAPPSKAFRMLRAGDSLLAFGGQCFTGRGRKDVVFRLEGNGWLMNFGDRPGWQRAPSL